MAVKNKKKLIIGVENQALPLAQANLVRDTLSNYYPEYEFHIQAVQLQNSALFNSPRYNQNLDRNATNELEMALRSHSIDCIVRNVKNLPLELPSDVTLAAYLPREDARDALVGSRIEHILPSAVIGFDCLLCAALFNTIRPDINIVIAIREIKAVFERFRSGEYNAIVLSAADLKWLGLEYEISEYLDPRVIIPAAGQGIIAIETNAGAKKMQDIVSKIHHDPTYYCAMAERAFVREIWQKFAIPVGAHAEIIDASLQLSVVLAPETGLPLYGNSFGLPEHAERIGQELAFVMLRNDSFSAES